MNSIIHYIPDLDPIPLPAPVWLLKFLLLLGFVLHLIPMNIMLGGLILTGISYYRKSDFHTGLVRRMSKMIPVVVALTITMGIAPLLFLQVLYGQYFYSSSIILAFPWLSVIILVMAAYYLVYIHSFRYKKLSHSSKTAIGWTAAILFAIVGFIYSNEMTLMLTPEKWGAKYFPDPSGLTLNLGEPTLFFRYLHFLVGALAVAAFFIACVGLSDKREKWFSSKAIKYGAGWFTRFTLVQYLVGILWLIALPADKMMLFMGKDIAGTVLLFLGIILSLGAIMMLNKASQSESPKTLVFSSGIALLATLIFMAIMRDILRNAYIAPHTAMENIPSFFQASTIIPFIVLLLVALGIIYWMMRKFLTMKAKT
ncbi:MAG: hypothetical protein GF315_08970 [candidate division Zixibacteria bacterium]|nr:hypothetical protein [candidate division Zixibacteria bacterium]